MTTEIEIESFLYSCGARLWEIINNDRYYEMSPNRYRFALGEIYGDYLLTTTSGGEGITVDLRKNKIYYTEKGNFNIIWFKWPTDKAILCQVIGILTNVEMCRGLNKKECRAFKRFLVASLLE